MKELEFINIAGGYGADQNKLATYFQRLGGCGAVTAADASIYLSKTFPRLQGLYTGPKEPISQADYQTYFEEVKRFLHPRIGGISRLETFADGFRAFAESKGVAVETTLFHGEKPYPAAEAFVRSALDAGYPLAYLLLLHQNPAFADYTWHWFLLTGYEARSDGFQVQIATFGKRHVLPLAPLWDTGHPKQGGMVLIR